LDERNNLNQANSGQKPTISGFNNFNILNKVGTGKSVEDGQHKNKVYQTPFLNNEAHIN